MAKPSEEYRKDFRLDVPDSELTTKAFEVALDTRKFEIGLYWQRTAYFWALIAAAFAGFFAVLSTSVTEKSFYAFSIACVGFVFSVAWFLVNRGSKFWQENWENHVDVLSENVAGPIFKTILCRKADAAHRKPFSEWVIGPGAVSVSKVNQWVSVFTIVIWLFLAGTVVLPLTAIGVRHIVVFAITLLFVVLLGCCTGTHLEEHRHQRIVKRSFISDD